MDIQTYSEAAKGSSSQILVSNILCGQIIQILRLYSLNLFRRLVVSLSKCFINILHHLMNILSRSISLILSQINQSIIINNRILINLKLINKIIQINLKLINNRIQINHKLINNRIQINLKINQIRKFNNLIPKPKTTWTQIRQY